MRGEKRKEHQPLFFPKEAQDKSSGQSPPKEVGRNGKTGKLPKREAVYKCGPKLVLRPGPHMHRVDPKQDSQD